MNNIYSNGFLYCSDSYKYSHHKQYPDDLVKLYSYFEARGFSSIFLHEPEVVWFGLYYYLKKLKGSLFTVEDVERANEFYKLHFNGKDIFNYEGFMYIAKQHNGKLPIKIKAVAEGTPIKPSNVLMTVENTDPKVPWLTNYVETLLTKVWYPTTVATHSREIKKTILHFLKRNTDDVLIDNIISFMLYDFGMRSATSDEAAALGGAAHLINFKGTDNISAIDFINIIYGGKFSNDKIAGFSVPASEHSVMTINSKNGEYSQFERVLRAYPDDAIVSIVSDSYDIFKLIEDVVCGGLKDYILSRSGKLVIRPDSGNPSQIIRHLLTILEKGYKEYITENSKGYKVLPTQLGIIWSDGIDHKDIHDILFNMDNWGWAASNIVFGMGGGLLQKVNRDTLKFAFKASYGEFADGRIVNIYKQPITDNGKRSKRGKLGLYNIDGEYKTFSSYSDMPHDHANILPDGNLLETVFENGEIIVNSFFDTIRENAEL
jgi:nicotinamide phosphoribosyltransferase